jgi:hypothetical protein
MTLKEKVKEISPEAVDNKYTGGVEGCPFHYDIGITEESCWDMCQGGDFCNDKTCTRCWGREYKEPTNE